MIYEGIDRWNTSDSYLEHYGVKGMRWGIRHDPVLVGHKSKKKTSNDRYREKMYNKTKDSYYKTASDKDIRRERNLKLARNIGIGVATAAVVALGAGAAYEYMRLHKDDTIKAGQIIQNVGNHDNMSVGNKFYGAVRNRDKAKYLGAWGQNKDGSFKTIYNATAKRDLKVLGYDNGKKIYDDMVRKNPAIKNYWSDYLDFNTYGLLGSGYGHNGWNAQNPIDKSNINAAVNIFKNEIKSKGYDLVGDANDRGKHGYHTKAFIDLGKNTDFYTNFTKTKVNSRQFNDARRKAVRYFTEESLQVPVTKVIGASGAGLFIASQFKLNNGKSQRDAKKKKSNG